MSVQLNGADKFQRKLAALQSGAGEIGRSVAIAGGVVMKDACKAAAPGSIKNEVGMSVGGQGEKTVVRVGLVKFPRRGDGQNGPHGIYLERGTKFIAARRFIQTALRSSRGRAIAAMRAAGKKRIQVIAGK